MKVIFLDFDGVLNCRRFIKRSGEVGVCIDPSRMDFLKRAVDETKALIVLSTSWREHWEKEPDKCDNIGREINSIFAGFGLKIFDKTDSFGRCREQQINEWLKKNTVENYVILDDFGMESENLKRHLIQTSDGRGGMTESDSAEAIRILNARAEL